jgi:hypothetical protein
MRRVRVLSLFWVCLLAFIPLFNSTNAAPPGNFAFDRLWSRADKPVAEGRVTRGWLWGPEALTPVLGEPSDDPNQAVQLTQYFDKGRMEFSLDPDVDRLGPSYVLSGAIARELVTGELRTGTGPSETRTPPTISLIGDPDDTTGPTYATFASLLDDPARPDESPVIERLERDGSISDDAALGAYGVTSAHRVSLPGLDHQIASPFWEYLTATGEIWQNNRFTEGQILEEPLVIVGLPLTEAYWTRTKVDGVDRDILIQVFERRVLTYNPKLQPGWQVQHANTGLHYLHWRYPDLGKLPVATDPNPALPAVSPPDLAGLEQRLRELVNGWSGQNAVTVTDLQTGQTISINGDRQQLAACTIKIFIMAAVAEDITAGRYTKESIEHLVVPFMGPSATWPGPELLRLIGDGDEGAGVKRVNDIMWSLGAKGSILTHAPGYYGAEYGYAQSHGVTDNYLTTDDLNLMLGKLYRGEALTPEQTEYVLWTMSIATPYLNGSLGGPLPPEATLYHKIGVLHEPLNTWNDTGIVVFDRGGHPYAYAVSILSSYTSGYQTGYSHGYTVSQLAWEAFSQSVAE